MKSIPNILTIGRLVLALAVLVLLAVGGDSIPGIRVLPEDHQVFRAWAFAAFVVAAVTDFFDGWLARKLGATSLLGAILDPIADKVLIAAAIVGLMADRQDWVGLPGGLILFREFAVSALRETLAPKGLRLPVTMLAKWKTTLQLIALGVMLGLPVALYTLIAAGVKDWVYLEEPAILVSYTLLWLAAAITVWTGIEYALAARRALKA
jgi:CDP-diacylglycerol--glycerol-3-phosphate 3-phosphatidyltransferase